MARKYNIDDNFFEKIDTESKAYILGFMYADGCVYSKKSEKWAKLDLKSDDISILNLIAKEMKNECPIKTYTYNKNQYFSNQDKYYEFTHSISRLSMRSSKIVDDLIKLGCTSKKTFDIKFPSEDFVPNNLVRHFIRGYFDGDGSLSYSVRKAKYGERLHFGMTFTGTYEMVVGIKQILNKFCCDFEGDIRSRHNNGVNNFTLAINGNDILLKVCDYMYQNSTINLERKYDKYKLLIQELDRRNSNPHAYNKKPFRLYKDGKYIDTFESAKSLELVSQERFGVKLLRPQISSCLNKRPGRSNIYKGFTFEFIA